MTENMTDPSPPAGIKHRLGRLRSGMANTPRRAGCSRKSLTPAYTEYIRRQLLQALEIAY